MRLSLQRLTGKLALFSVLTLLTLLLGEMSFRLWKFRSVENRTMWVLDHDLGYGLNPKNLETPEGFRGGLRLPDADEQLIVCLGGSTTYGYRMPAALAWPSLLETKLREAGCPQKTLNAGVPGYGSRESLLRYRRDIRPLRPAVLIVHSLWNGAGPLVDPAKFRPGIVSRDDDGLIQRLLVLASRHSVLVQRVVVTLRLDQNVTAWRPDPYRSDWTDDLRSLLAEAQSDGVRVCLVGPPALYHAGQTDVESTLYTRHFMQPGASASDRLAEYRWKLATMAEIATRAGATFVDVQSAFVTRGEQRKEYFIDEIHLTPQGDELLARELMPAVQSLLGCR